MTDFQKSLTRFMYVTLVVVAVVMLLWAFASPGHRRQAFVACDSAGRYGQAPAGITTTGTCVVRSRPDVAELTIGVAQSATTATAANKYVKSTIGKVSRMLTDGGVAPKDIQTQSYHLRLEWHSYRTQGYKDRRVKNWNAGEELRVRIRDLDKVAELVDGAIGAGANTIGSLNYTVDDVNKLREQGRAKASGVARRKARQLASSLGGKLGRLISCSEGYPSYYQNAQANVAYSQMELDKPEQTELTIQPGELVMNVTVTASYALE